MAATYTKHLRILEIIALNGRISSYKLSKELGVSVGHAQWWLRNHPEIVEVGRDPKGRRTVWYGLSMIGFLLALKRPKVKRYFAWAFEQFLNNLGGWKNDPILMRNTLKALENKDLSEKIKQYYLSVSKGLDDLTDIYRLPDDTVVELATILAFRQDERVFTNFRDLYLANVLLFKRIIMIFQTIATEFDNILRGGNA
jgi:hypothetical protein